VAAKNASPFLFRRFFFIIDAVEPVVKDAAVKVSQIRSNGILIANIERTGIVIVA